MISHACVSIQRFSVVVANIPSADYLHVRQTKETLELLLFDSYANTTQTF